VLKLVKIKRDGYDYLCAKAKFAPALEDDKEREEILAIYEIL